MATPWSQALKAWPGVGDVMGVFSRGHEGYLGETMSLEVIFHTIISVSYFLLITQVLYCAGKLKVSMVVICLVWFLE
jgi:hypothetical protein